MAEMQIPNYMTNRPVNVAELVDQMSVMRSRNMQQKLMEQRMQQEQQEQARQEQLRGLFQNGQRPTVDQMYSIDPAMGMKYESQQNDMNNIKGQTQKYMMAKDIASTIINRLQQVGASPDAPDFQQKLDQIGAPFRQPLSQIFGKQDDPNKPIDWNALQTLAAFQPKSENEYHPTVATNNGILEYRDGRFQPLQIDGNTVMPPQYDPNIQARVMAAKEGQKGVVVENQAGQKYRDTQLNASGGRIGNYGQIDHVEAQALMQAAREDNPDIAMRDNARQQLEAMSQQQGLSEGPVMSQSPAEETAAKETAKASAQATMDLPRVEAQTSQTLQLLDDLKNHPGLSGVVGVPSASGVLRIPGTDEASFRERLEQIKGKAFLEAFNSLKGGGQITEVEGEKATKAIARLGTAQTEKEFIKAIEELQGIAATGLDNLRKKAGTQPAQQGGSPQTGRVKFLGFE